MSHASSSAPLSVDQARTESAGYLALALLGERRPLQVLPSAAGHYIGTADEDGLVSRELRCLVIIDLKLGSLTHADVGQMHMYCNYAKEHWAYPDENPPVSLILCADKGHALARYALEGLPTKVMAANYRMMLPDAELLQKELENTRRLLESRVKTRQR